MFKDWMTKLDYIVALKILLEHSVNFNKKQYEVLIQNDKKMLKSSIQN